MQPAGAYHKFRIKSECMLQVGMEDIIQAQNTY